MSEHRTDYEIVRDALDFARREVDEKASELAAKLSLLIECDGDRKPGWKAAHRASYDESLRVLRATERYVGECQSRFARSAMPIGYTSRR